LRIAAISLVVAALSVTVAQARIAGVQVIPPRPTIADSVSVRVAGDFPDGCWSVSPVTCGPHVDGTIGISVDAVDHATVPGACPLVFVTYVDSCRYGRLPAGDYQVVFTEHHTSIRDPKSQQLVVSFSVTDATPVRPSTWGTLKLIYR
jgi:hypothetical protein